MIDSLKFGRFRQEYNSPVILIVNGDFIVKVAGIIAEYNPFHNGHAYHIEETKKRTNADYIIAVMSGNFVQRGAPAILNKYDRTRMALENGADLVIELPVTAALSSAEGFASGGVGLLAGLGVVTDISFGAEISAPRDVDTLRAAAKLFVTEPVEFQKTLSSYLKQGYSFPAARTMAIGDYSDIYPFSKAELSKLLSSPNNILAVEYLKAIEKYRYPLSPCIISRTGGGYHKQNLGDQFASASAIRNFLLSDNPMVNTQAEQFSHVPDAICHSKVSERFPDTFRPAFISKHVPDSVCRTLSLALDTHCLLQENDFSDMLFYALTEHAQEIGHYGSPNTDFALRIESILEQFETWAQFALALKSKNQTYTAISRYLAHILLGITREDMSLAAQFQFAPYARILGFRKASAPLIKEVHKKSRIPVITRLAKEHGFLSPNQQRLINLDIRASEIYNRAVFSRSDQKICSDYRHPLIYI